MVIKCFCFPTTSKHALFFAATWSMYASGNAMSNESILSSDQAQMLKAIGSSRIPQHQMETITCNMYPDLNMTTSLLKRERRNGINEHVGADDDTTMVQFLDVGMKWRADGCSFNVHTTHPQLLYWSGQCPLEKKLSVLCNDVYFMDTTHHVCVHDLKTGP